MTVLEKEIFDKALIKQKENLIKPQVVQGKTFKGQSFISKPEKIIFKVNDNFISEINSYIWI